MDFDDIIAKRLICERDERPFDCCDTCERPLKDVAMAMVAKGYDRGHLLYETAQCLECQQQYADQISEQSSENMRCYAQSRMLAFLENPQQRQFYQLQEPCCLLTGERLKLQEGFELYTILGAPSGDEPFFFVGPTAMEQLFDLMSKETKEIWGQFMDSLDPALGEHRPSPLLLR